jgi:hypothetical protein
MKKYIKTLSVVSLFAVTSCNDLLTEVPRNRLAQETFFKTAQDAESSVFGIYAPMREPEAYRTWFPAMLTNLNDYTFGRGSQVAISEYQGLDGTNIVRAELVWQRLYQSINYSNISIQEIPKVDMNETKKKELIAEAKFLRALNYFNMVRLFGAIPIRTEPFVDIDKIAGKRMPVSEVYKLIEADLMQAETDLPDKGAQEGRPTKWAAKTLLADAYLTTEQWQKAASKADEVIKSGKFSLVDVKVSDDFLKIFGPTVQTTTEDIFSLKFSRVDQLGWSYVVFPHATNTPYSPGGFRAHFTRPTFPLIRDWAKEDLRKDFNLYTDYVDRVTNRVVALPAAEPICFRKYRDGAAPSNNASGNDYYFYRYADALLIYAEASVMAENGPNELAIERLNMVKRRAYGQNPMDASAIDVKSGLSKEAFRETVLVERAYEFMLEFKRWFDLKRMGTTYLKSKIKEALNRDVKDVHLLWPIPKVEIDNNPDMKPADQNPGY